MHKISDIRAGRLRLQLVRMHGVFVLIAAVLLSLAAAEIWEHEVYTAEGEMISLSKYQDSKVVVIVNVASNCGFTYSNYRELVDLYDKYHDKGLEILAFPCNQFGEQEPGSDKQIKSFCTNYGVNFPVMKKINVNGPTAIDLFKYLKEETGGVEINWNFNKFLIVDGKPVRRFPGNVRPNAMLDDILPHLAGPSDL